MEKGEDPTGKSEIQYIFSDRSSGTKDRCTKGSFRVVCYNTLADYHAGPEKGKVFYPYCSEEALDINYRKQILIKELKAYNADILLLQEIDEKIFYDTLQPILSKQHYDGIFGIKDGIPEGVATFFKKDKLKIVTSENTVICKVLMEDRHTTLQQKIFKNTRLKVNVFSRETCVLTILLQSLDRNNEYLFVSNAHLHWQECGQNVRAIQAQTMIQEIKWLKEKWIREYELRHTEDSFAHIIAGDFNDDPYSASVELLTKGNVPCNHVDWFVKGEAEYANLHLENQLALFESACGYPAYTCYVPDYRVCIDYIFIESSRLRVEKVIPPPSHDDVTRFTALPSKNSSSDHIAQVVELTWK